MRKPGTFFERYAVSLDFCFTSSGDQYERNTGQSEGRGWDLNYQIFLTDLPRLIVDNRGRYAVYRRQRFVDHFDIFSAAVAYGGTAYTGPASQGEK